MKNHGEFCPVNDFQYFYIVHRSFNEGKHYPPKPLVKKGPIVQGIERKFPKLQIQVRVLVGLHI